LRKPSSERQKTRLPKRTGGKGGGHEKRRKAKKRKVERGIPQRMPEEPQNKSLFGSEKKKKGGKLKSKGWGKKRASRTSCQKGRATTQNTKGKRGGKRSKKKIAGGDKSKISIGTGPNVRYRQKRGRGGKEYQKMEKRKKKTRAWWF